MARALGMVSLLVTLVAIGWMLTAQQSGSSSPAKATQQVDQAQVTANAVAFQQAEAQLEQQHAVNGSYVGTSLNGFGVKLVQADANSYCIQNATAHLAGPGGAVANGRC